MMEEVKLFPVEDFLGKYPHMFIGWTAAAYSDRRAMIMGPNLLVADEPVSMLDASVRVEILKLLRGLQETHHLSVIYITHDLSTVSYFSERIFVMYAGQVVEKAKVERLLYNPCHPYTWRCWRHLRPGCHNARHSRKSRRRAAQPGEPTRGCRSIRAVPV